MKVVSFLLTLGITLGILLGVNGGGLGRGLKGGSFCLKTNGAAAVSTKISICEAFEATNKTFTRYVTEIYPDEDFVQVDFIAQSVRLAFHDAGEHDIRSTDDLGPDGCVSNIEDNAAFLDPIEFTATVYEDMWQDHCDSISRADFYAMLAMLSLEFADKTDQLRIRYQFGRTDNSECETGVRIPTAQSNWEQTLAYYENQLGLTANDTVTLLGGHSIGHVHRDTSGYGFNAPPGANPKVNAWDNTPGQLDNLYYRSMILVPWANTRQAKDDGSTPTTSIWIVALNFQSPSIMLNTDMALAFDINDETDTPCFQCGTEFQQCGGVNDASCISPSKGFNPDRIEQIRAYTDYLNGNALFLADFARSWLKVVTLGYGVPDAIDGATSTGRLGTVTEIDLATCTEILLASTLNPTKDPTEEPTEDPTEEPTLEPTLGPTGEPPSLQLDTQTGSAVNQGSAGPFVYTKTIRFLNAASSSLLPAQVDALAIVLAANIPMMSPGVGSGSSVTVRQMNNNHLHLHDVSYSYKVLVTVIVGEADILASKYQNDREGLSAYLESLFSSAQFLDTVLQAYKALNSQFNLQAEDNLALYVAETQNPLGIAPTMIPTNSGGASSSASKESSGIGGLDTWILVSSILAGLFGVSIVILVLFIYLIRERKRKEAGVE